MRHKISNNLNTSFILSIILVISALVVIIVTITYENHSNSISDSFAAAVSDRKFTKTTIDTSNYLQAPNLQLSSQQNTIANNSSLGESNSSSSISYSSNNNNNITLPQVKDPNLTVEVVVDGLNMPTTMAFLDKDDFLILQKNGSLVRIVDGVLLDKTRLDVPVAKGFYQGLLGIAVTNQSISTKNNETYVFLYYTEVSTI